MFTLKKFPIKSLKNKDLLERVKGYIKHNKCCNSYPNCTHPKTQSDPNILFNEKFKEVLEETLFCIQEACKETINKELKKKQSIVNTKLWCWAFLQKKGTVNKKYNWHDHLVGDEKNQTSFLIYLTPTDKGTIFINDYGAKELLIPETNHIFIWESKYVHSPDIGTFDEDRIVLAGNCTF